MVQLEYVHSRAIIKRSNYKNVHKCETCPYFSKSIFSMVNHVRRHRLALQLFDCQRNDLELYCCKNCDSTFDSIIHLRKHIKEVHRIIENEVEFGHTLRRYICRFCSFETHSTLQWLKHCGCRSDEFQEKRLVTDKTKQVTEELSKVQNHNNCNNPKKGIDHNKCEYNIAKHLNGDDRVWFYCEQCTFKALRGDIVSTHFQAKHTKHKNKTWKHCDQCEYKSLFKSNLKLHFTARHTKYENKKWWHCDKCKYKAILKSHLKRHFSAKHMDDDDKKWFRCDKCTFKTLRKYDLKNHCSAKHTKDENKKWLQCDKCEHKTLQKNNLKRHISARHWLHGIIPKKKNIVIFSL